MTEFYAQPYSIDHQGFYFNDLDTYQKGMSNLKAQGCEEVEIQFTDGQPHQSELASSAQISQIDITLWFEALDELGSYQAQQLNYLLEARLHTL